MALSARKTVRSIACALIAIGLLAASAGCIQITPTPEPATVTFACSQQEEEHYQSLIEAFQQEHRHITVDLVRSAQFRLPDADVYEITPFARRFMLQQELEVLDLTPFVEQGDSFEREDFYPGLVEMFRDEDEQWGVPYSIDVGVMYYNRDLFDKYGVTYPGLEWTWDDFMRTAQAMYDPDAGVFGYVPDEDKDDALAFVYQNGGRIFDDFQNPTRTTFNDPLTIEAMEWYGKLMYEHEAIATPRQAREAFYITGYVREGIKQGRLGMWTAGFSERGGRLEAESWDIDWGIVPLPKGTQSATFAFATGYVISAQAESPDAAWEWVSFLTRQTPRYGMPVRRSVVESEAFEDQAGKDVAAVARVSIEHALLFSPAGWDIYGTFQIFNEAVEKVMSGQVTAQEAMEWAQETSQYK